MEVIGVEERVTVLEMVMLDSDVVEVDEVVSGGGLVGAHGVAPRTHIFILPTDYNNFVDYAQLFFLTTHYQVNG